MRLVRFTDALFVVAIIAFVVWWWDLLRFL
jgi:hypothetical protein